MTFESPLKYLNQDGEARCHAIFQNRPAQTNNTTLKIGTFWIDQDDERVELLASYSANEGNYILVGDGPTSMETLTGNVGGAVNPSALGNIDIVGGQTSVVGTPASNLLTFSFTETDPTFGSLIMSGDVTFEGGSIASETDTGTNDTWTLTAEADTTTIIHKLSGTTTAQNFQVRNSSDVVRLVVRGDTTSFQSVNFQSPIFQGTVTTAGGSVISETNTGTNDVWEVTADADTTNFIFAPGGTTTNALRIENQSGALLVIQANGAAQLNGAGIIDGNTTLFTGGALNLRGDTGGDASTTTFTNVVDSGVSTGVMTINTTTGNNGSNTGFYKALLDTTPIYIPYFANIAP